MSLSSSRYWWIQFVLAQCHMNASVSHYVNIQTPLGIAWKGNKQIYIYTYIKNPLLQYHTTLTYRHPSALPGKVINKYIYTYINKTLLASTSTHTYFITTDAQKQDNCKIFWYCSESLPKYQERGDEHQQADSSFLPLQYYTVSILHFPKSLQFCKHFVP